MYNSSNATQSMWDSFKNKYLPTNLNSQEVCNNYNNNNNNIKVTYGPFPKLGSGPPSRLHNNAEEARQEWAVMEYFGFFTYCVVRRAKCRKHLKPHQRLHRCHSQGIMERESLLQMRRRWNWCIHTHVYVEAGRRATESLKWTGKIVLPQNGVSLNPIQETYRHTYTLPMPSPARSPTHIIICFPCRWVLATWAKVSRRISTLCCCCCQWHYIRLLWSCWRILGVRGNEEGRVCEPTRLFQYSETGDLHTNTGK